MEPIIKSLLDTDLYKFTMQQVVFHRFPGAMVEYRFKCRTRGIDLTPFVAEIRSEIDKLCDLRFTVEELDYLRSQPFFKNDYVDFLEDFKLKSRFISVEKTPGTSGEIDITINGPWLQTILFEVPVLAIVNEVYFRNTVPQPDFKEGQNRLVEKLRLLDGLDSDKTQFKFSEFGTRRRFSRDWQGHVVNFMKSVAPVNLVGTSNVDLARCYNLTPIGTMAHEYLQAAQALGPNVRDSQTFAFQVWAEEYRGQLGIALSDVVGMDAFLRDFDLYFSKLYDGARQDSGDPFEWGEKLVKHYTAMGIDSATKKALFSDGLDFKKAIKLYQSFKGRLNTAYGIGTNLTNDLGYEPLNIVIKMVSCNGRPVAKLSDSPGKVMSHDDLYIAYLKDVFKA